LIRKIRSKDQWIVSFWNWLHKIFCI
jgi:hypothetical protein